MPTLPEAPPAHAPVFLDPISYDGRISSFFTPCRRDAPNTKATAKELHAQESGREYIYEWGRERRVRGWV